MSANSKKKADDKHLKILRELVAYDENRHCFDCNQRGPTYVNVTIGCFVCTNCGGALRKYNHRVKSISMSNFTPAEMDFLKKRGNAMCRKMYFGLCDRQTAPEPDVKNGLLDSFLRQKYELKKWYLEPSKELEEETTQSNQQIFDRVEKVGGRSSATRPLVGNTAAGLIVQPPKPINPQPLQMQSRVSVNGDANLMGATSSGQGAGLPTAVSVPNMKTSNTNDLLADLGGDPFAPAPAPALPLSFPPPPSAASAGFRPSASSTATLAPAPVNGAATVSLAPSPATTGHHGGSPMVPAGDKYAALAELDGLFGGTTTAPASRGGMPGSGMGGAAPWKGSPAAPSAVGSSAAGYKPQGAMSWASPGTTGGWPYQDGAASSVSGAVAGHPPPMANPFGPTPGAASYAANPFAAGPSYPTGASVGGWTGATPGGASGFGQMGASPAASGNFMSPNSSGSVFPTSNINPFMASQPSSGGYPSATSTNPFL